MKKERLKNLILTTLIISAFFLTSQIWFNKKLWPDGYNFFGYAENLPIIGRFFNADSTDTDIEKSVAQLALPYKAVVSSNGKREVFAPGEAEFDVIIRMSFSVIDDLFKSQNTEYSTASLSEIKTALSDNSVFLTFEYDMDTAFIAGARTIESETISQIAPYFAHIVLTCDMNGNGIVYLCTSDNRSAYRFVVPTNAARVQQIISAYSRQNENYAFAYELNLDAPLDSDNLTDRLYLSSFVLVNIGAEKPEKTVTAYAPFSKEPNRDICDSLVKTFGLEANNLRRSESSDGTQKYIENSATITVSPNGTVTYTAVENQQGITAETTSEKIETILKIAIGQWSLMGSADRLSLCVADNMTENNGHTVISFNYLINGKPIIFNSGKCENCITAYFEGSKLMSAKFRLCRIEVLEETATAMPMLQNFDAAYEQLNINSVVTHAISCYNVKPNFAEPITPALAITYGDITGVVD